MALNVQSILSCVELYTCLPYDRNNYLFLKYHSTHFKIIVVKYLNMFHWSRSKSRTLRWICYGRNISAPTGRFVTILGFSSVKDSSSRSEITESANFPFHVPRLFLISIWSTLIWHALWFLRIWVVFAYNSLSFKERILFDGILRERLVSVRVSLL